MSYRGRPSKGCNSCRAKKVKCDEGKPICGRCSKLGNECNYRDKGDLIFRNQTTFAAQKAEESWRKRSKVVQQEVSESSGSPYSVVEGSQSPSHSNQIHPQGSTQHSPYTSTTAKASPSIVDFNNDLSIGQGIRPDLRQLAYQRFLYDFVVYETPSRDAGSPTYALWDFIPILYETSGEGSALQTVVHAVSFANFSSRCNAPFAQELAAEYHGRGLNLLQQQMLNKKVASTDESLATVYLMNVYEALTSSSRDGIAVSHMDGANALLQLRAVDSFFGNAISARLYETSYAQMLMTSLITSKPPMVSVQSVVAARQHLPGLYSTSGVYYIQLIHHTATLHAKWAAVKSNAAQPTGRDDLQYILREALDLDAEFETWESTIPASWKFEIQHNTPESRAKYKAKWAQLILNTNGAPVELHKYDNLKRCVNWMLYRSSRIHLLGDMIEMLDQSLALPESTNLSGKSTIALMDSYTLGVYRNFATSHLTTLIEHSCSSVIAHFTVPIDGKPIEDVAGLRAYTIYWSLWVTVCVLGSGLIPDSGRTSPASTVGDPAIYAGPTSGSIEPSYFRNLPFPSPSMFKQPDNRPFNQYYLEHSHLAANPTEFPNLDRIAPPPPPQQPSAPNFSTEFNAGKPSPGIDIAARTEWIHRLLYYMGTELGLKKALVIVNLKGYTEKSRIAIEALGHSNQNYPQGQA